MCRSRGQMSQKQSPKPREQTSGRSAADVFFQLLARWEACPAAILCRESQSEQGAGCCAPGSASLNRYYRWADDFIKRRHGANVRREIRSSLITKDRIDARRPQMFFFWVAIVIYVKRFYCQMPFCGIILIRASHSSHNLPPDRKCPPGL